MSILCQLRFSQEIKKFFCSIFIVPGTATVTDSRRVRFSGGRMVSRLFWRVERKREGELAVGNLSFLRQRPREEKSANKVFVPPISMPRNMF